MSTPGQNPLTELALSVQSENQRFQQELTAASLQTAENPAAALLAFNQCWTEADPLERKEMDFLAMMGEFGVQQASAARESWGQNRLQILIGEAQVLFLLARYDECQAAIDSARPYASGAAEVASSILDQLEIGILQMKS